MARRERTRLQSRQRNAADDAVVALHRYAQHRASQRNCEQRRIVIGVQPEIRNHLHFARQQHPRPCGRASRPLRRLAQPCDEFRLGLIVRNRSDPERLALLKVEDAQIRRRQFGRAKRQRVEHRLEIERRAANHLQHIRRRRLLRQRLFQIARSPLHLLEQPRILDGDHGLIGEGLDQIDDALRVDSGLRLRHHDDADEIVAALHWHAKRGAVLHGAAQIFGIIGIAKQIGDVLDFACQGDARGDRASAGGLRVGAHIGVEVIAPLALRKGVVVHGAVAPVPDRPICRAAQRDRRIDQRVQHRLRVEGRAIDRLQHIGGRRLLGEGFPRLAEPPCVLDGDDGLIGEGAEGGDLIFGERLPGPTRDDQRTDSALARDHRRIERRQAAVSYYSRAFVLRQACDLGEIGDMDRAPLGDRPAGGASRQRRGVRPPVALGEAASGCALHHVALDQIDRRAIGAEQALTGVQNGVEHRRGVRAGAADDAQHLSRRRLFASRRLEFAAQRIPFRRRLHILAKIVQGVLNPLSRARLHG